MSNVKGSQLLGVVKALRKLRAVSAFDVPAHLERYFAERLVVGAWYPEIDLRDLVLLLGGLLAGHVEGNVWRYIGRSGAEQDFDGIYSALVRPGDTEWTVRRMSHGWRQYRDHGELTVQMLGDGRAALELSDYEVMCPELAEVNAGYFEGTLRASGARDPSVEIVASDSRSAGFIASWQPSPCEAPAK